MELVRLLLLRSEGDAKAQELAEKYPVSQRAYHVALLKDAGFVEAIIRKDENDFPAAAKVLRLTWQGHEFLDLTRDDKVWCFVKSKVLKPGVSWTMSILTELLKAEAKRQLGVFLPNASDAEQ